METLVDLVAEAGRRHGHRPALIIRPGFRTRTWRFRDLAETTPRVARVIREAGIEPGDRIIIWAVNRPEWGIAFLGAVHGGAVLVPLDVRQAADFGRRVAEQTQAKLVIASHQTLDAARTLGLPVITIESLPDRARAAQPLQAPPLGRDDPVEIVFTSGTTGEPKGAVLTHGNLVSNAQALLEVFSLRPDERLLSVLPLSHMFEQTVGFITPLLAGASVVYPVSRQPAVLVRTFKDFRATMLLIVPQGLKLLDNAIERKVDAGGKRATFERLHRIARHLPRGLRRILFRPVLSQFGGRLSTVAVGGAAMDPQLATRWMEMGVEVLQGYGTTELSPVVSFTRRERNRLGTVGEAIPGVELKLAADGEVLVRGPGRFPGYWENTDATAAAIDAEGWYHTGDLGELDADGVLTLRGRKKDMLVLGDGSNVYPEDIEAVLERDPRLKGSTVVGWPPGGDPKVHAVLVPHDGADPDEIIRAANARLGSHQQIRGHTVWPDDDLPRTHTLKVKKRFVLERLAELEGAAARSPAADRSPPTGDVPVSALQALVASVADLQPAAIGPDARLSADLGMDSLARVELLGMIEEELGTYIDDGDIAEDTTVGELEAMVEARREAKRETGIYGWPLNPAVRALRIGLQQLMILPLVALFYRVRVRGEERLRGLTGPVLFVPNHHLHTDNAIILSSLPIIWRWRLSVAAAADDIFGNRLKGLGAAVLGNAFPLAREGAVRRSLELLGARLDRDFSVLIYPEGKLTVGGPMQPFLSGTGMIAVQGALPVVPMKVKINRMSWIDARGPDSGPRGDVEVIFGEPIIFDGDTEMSVATERIETAVAAL
jgi:long-chain acyl-CoA synthetase